MLISQLFPNAKKSNVRCPSTGKRMQSYKNIDINVSKTARTISYEEIHRMIPENWFILKKFATFTVFGYLFDITFNGQNSFLHFTFNDNNTISVNIDNKPVDIALYNIPATVKYSFTSIPALFRCVKLIRPCQGYEITSEGDKFLSSSCKCSKEICKVKEADAKHIIRHEDCKRYVPIKSNSSNNTCKICAQFVKNKKKKHSKSENKENDNLDKSEDEVLSQLKVLAPNLHANQLSLLHTQIVASNMKSKKGMRWDKDVHCMALSLFNRNPAAYRDLTQNNWLQLPSESTIKVYKHAVQQGPGIVNDMMLWMHNEAERQNLITEGYYGGIILDEMVIQEDLQIVHTKSDTKLFGLPNSGEDARKMNALSEGKFEWQLANHVQQYVFSGLTGFRWPFANYPNLQAPPAEIFSTTWICIDELSKWGFKPCYCCMDGSANNRAFLKMHFPSGNPIDDKMVAKWFRNPLQKIVFLMDPSHLIKKIRNSVLSSGFLDSHQRLLTLNSKFIVWKMWIDAYQWDRSTNSFQIHQKLNDEHIFPNNSQKMRNKLAFQCLDADMLNLMKCYTDSLNTAAQSEMVAVLEFLKYTSVIVALFTDSRPIKATSDIRLKEFSECYNWFKAWEKQGADNDIHKRHKSLLTMETREDIAFLYHGFMSLIKICLYEIKTEVVANRINSDIIENIFCQERALYHGANTNPNYNDYRTGINSIILGQTTTSKKSKVGGHRAKPFALGGPPKKMKCKYLMMF